MRPLDRVFDRFEIQRKAGVGAMGSVYRALDHETGDAVALKVLHDGTASVDAARFAREASVLAAIKHPGIVRYVAHGAHQGELFLAMEWLDGEDLASHLSHGPLSVREAVTLARGLSAALAVAHRRGVVHRDIKPSNVFLCGGSIDRAKIIDFGIARFTREGREVTLTGALIGTPGYMAPEQANGARHVDARADVFALACVIYRAIAGRAPFLGDHIVAVLAKTMVEEPPRLATFSRRVPAALDELLARMLAKDPSERPASAAEVASALEAIDPDAGDSRPPETSTTSLTSAERRVVSVLFVGTTEESPQASSAGAERDARIAQVVEPYGGVVTRLGDGSRFVTLAGNEAVSDQAARAAQCALSLRRALAGAPMALATGAGIVSLQSGRLHPAGEVIDRGASLLRHESADGVRLDEATAGLLGLGFDVSGDASGLYLRGERDVVEATRTLLGRPYPCVGRDRELATLEAIFDECASEPVARCVLITAPAGRGKSRVRFELLQRLRARGERIEVLLGRGDSVSAGSPFSMLAPAIRRSAGILDGQAPDVAHRKLRARLARHLSGDRLTRAAELLGELARVPSPLPSEALRSARESAVLMSDGMLSAFQDWLEAECEAHPVLLVLEDLHWGDLPSVRFVEAALRHLARAPLMVLALARPEVEEKFPGLWAQRDVQPMRLGVLTPKSSERLAREMLGETVKESTISLVLERAGGNAFYLEELIRAVSEGVELCASARPSDLPLGFGSSDGERLAPPLSSDVARAGWPLGIFAEPTAATRQRAARDAPLLPDTVLGMVQARLDALGAEAKRLLRAASVFGQVFWTGGVLALLGGETHGGGVEEWLDELVSREVVADRGTSGIEGETAYIFRHALLRDAAYAMLTDADRILGHRLAGAWLEQAGETDSIVLAEHFDRGHEPSRAIPFYVRAAEQALESSDLAAVIERADRGVALGARGPQLGALRFVQAEAHRWRGELSLSAKRGVLAAAELDAGSAAWFRAVGELITTLGQQGQIGELDRWVEEVTAITMDRDEAGAQIVCLCRAALSLLHAGRAEVADGLIRHVEMVLGDLSDMAPIEAARVHQAWATRARHAGQTAKALHEYRAALPGFEHAGDRRNAAHTRVNLGLAYAELGDFDSAEEVLLSAEEVTVRMGLESLSAWSQNNLGNVLLRRGDVREARRRLERALESARQQGNLRLEVASRIYLSRAALSLGDAKQAARQADIATRLSQGIDPLRAMSLASVAHVVLATSVPDGTPEYEARAKVACERASEALALVDSLGGTEGEAFVRLVFAEALAASGDWQAARGAIAAARKRLLDRAGAIEDAALAESFLTRVAENDRTLHLATEWGA